MDWVRGARCQDACQWPFVNTLYVSALVSISSFSFSSSIFQHPFQNLYPPIRGYQHIFRSKGLDRHTKICWLPLVGGVILYQKSTLLSTIIDTIVILQGCSNPHAFEVMSIAEKNRVIDELKLPGTYVTAVGPTNAQQRPVLQIVSAAYKRFGEITDTELVAESLYPRAKLSALELRILLRRLSTPLQ